MNSSAENYGVPSNIAALTRLAAGSAITIGTILVLSDTIAFAFTISNPMVWMIKSLGIWLTVGILWFTSFLVIVSLISLISGPILISNQGIKLRRFGKFFIWDNIKAITIDEQNVFSKLFFLGKTVHKLTIYVNNGKNSMSPLTVPSFLFSPKDFDFFVKDISRRALGSEPTALGFALFNLKDQNRFRKMQKQAEIMRVVFCIIATIGLVSFVGRKATVAYEYNRGLKEFTSANYERAVSHLLSATKTDPGFAMAWDRLGWAEYILHRNEEAERSWHNALLCKPDLVESKIGLAELYIKRNELPAAEKLLFQCISLSPYQSTAYVDIANIYYREAKPELSMQFLDKALSRGHTNIQSYLRYMQLYKRYGFTNKAKTLAELILHSDPDNIEAQQLIRTLR
jgi:cytochrome c-type biogenesis protein CcmH/NrfG